MMQRIIVFVCTLFLSVAAIADVYKWVDADGKIHFGDKKPQTNKVETLNLPTTGESANRTAEPANSDDYQIRQRKLLNAITEDRILKQKKAQEKAIQQAKYIQNCTKAREYYNYISSGTLYSIDAKGERVYLSDNQREQEMKNVQNYIKQNCR